MNKIRRIKKPLTLVMATNDNVITGTIAVNGIFKGASVTVPNLDYATGTITASILNTEGGTVWSKASIVEGATTSVYVDGNNNYFNQPLYGTLTLKIQTNAGQTADRDFIFYVYYQA